MPGETWNFWTINICGSDSTDVAVVLVSDGGSVIVVAFVIVENDLAGSGFGNGDVATMDDGILGIDARRVLRHSDDMELRSVRLGSSSLLPGQNCKASMKVYGQGRH